MPERNGVQAGDSGDACGFRLAGEKTMSRKNIAPNHISDSLRQPLNCGFSIIEYQEIEPTIAADSFQKSKVFLMIV